MDDITHIDDSYCVAGIKAYTAADLWEQAEAQAGKALFYMQFLTPEINGGQRIRIEQMCYHLASEWNNHLEDTKENRRWFREWMEKFGDETENFC